MTCCPSAADGEQRGLVHQVRQFGAREARRSARDLAEIHSHADGDFARVDAENLLPSPHIRCAHGHVTIEPAGPQQRRIQNVGTVGRGNHDDAGVRREAVHLDEELVQRLLALLVAQRIAAAAAADGVELVDEDDARLVTPRVLEQLADARCADAGVHLDEIRAAREQERHLRFAGNGPGQQRLARAWRADEQHPFRDPSADRLEAAGVAQEIDELFHFFLGFVDARHVLERHGHRFRIGLAHLALERGDAARCDPIHHHAERRDEPDAEHGRDVVVGGRFRERLHIDPDVFAREIGDERGVGGHVVARRRRAERLSVRTSDLEVVPGDDDRRHRAALEVTQEVRERRACD